MIPLEQVWFAMWRAAMVVFALVFFGVIPPPWDDK
jgi:hypothetical protein